MKNLLYFDDTSCFLCGGALDPRAAIADLVLRGMLHPTCSDRVNLEWQDRSRSARGRRIGKKAFRARVAALRTGGRK